MPRSDFKGAYWISSNIAIAILNFSLLLPIQLSLFRLNCDSKVVALNPFASFFVDWFIASFLYCFQYSYRSSNYCDSNSCRSFTLLKHQGRVKIHISLSPSRASRSNHFTFTLCYRFKERQLGRAITKGGAIQKSPILLSQYWINEEFELVQ